MAGRIYTVSFSAVAVTAAQDLFELTPSANKPIEILGLMLSQHSDFGDAQDEVLQIKTIRGFTASGSGGSAPTPTPLSSIDTAAGFTAKVNDTTQANTGSTTTLHVDGWNVRAGYMLWLPEGCGWAASAANTTIVIQQTVPADSITMNGTVYVREMY